jgi:hypothetical protein
LDAILTRKTDVGDLKGRSENGEGKMKYRVEVGLLILLIAFVVYLLGGLGLGIDLSEYRIVPVLEANPNRYWDYIRDAFLFEILPPAVGLVFSIIAFVEERKSPTGVLKWWLPLVAVGGFFFFWGVYGLQWTYTKYNDLIPYSSGDTAEAIRKICAATMAGFVLWLSAGLLFMLSPVFKEKRAATTNS